MSCSYLSKALDCTHRKDVIARTIAAVKNWQPFPDAIACRGTSGLLIAPSVADAFGLPLIVVRKPNDGSHSSSIIEAPNMPDSFNYVVIDDLISTGNTIKTIEREISALYWHASLSAVFIYAPQEGASNEYESLAAGHPVIRV